MDKKAAFIHKNRQNHSRKRNKIAFIFFDQLRKEINLEDF